VADPLLVVDVQLGFLNDYTRHIPGRILELIERDRPEPILMTRFVNERSGPYQRFLDWHACESEPETNLAPELAAYANDELTFTKPGLAGISDELREYLKEKCYERITLAGIDTDMCVLKIALDIFDLGIEPNVMVDCCASTAGLQAHLAGLAVLARNIGAERLRDAGLSGGQLAAPTPSKPLAASH
jgi:nicotinamidase-related amidase